jgi:hypothetical protein
MTTKKVSRNKQTKKQIASSIALERRKTKRRISGTGETEITNEMVGDLLAISCADRIHGMLPKPKPKRPVLQQQEKKNPRPWTSLPMKPLKRNVLWMTMKEQDASSTMSLSDEIKSFAEYVSVRYNTQVLVSSQLVRAVNSADVAFTLCIRRDSTLDKICTFSRQRSTPILPFFL